MNIKCMYYSKQFQNKPKGYEVAEVQKNLSQTEITIEQLADGLSHGATFKPALLNGTHSADWISQKLFALDFDHDTTIQEQLEKCSQLNIYPCFGYTSFSHTEQEHHFRLVFCTDKVITDVETRNKLQNTLISIFDKSDNVTKDCTRIFFGGRTLICNDFDRRINGYQIIDRYYEESLQKPTKVSNSKTCKKKLDYNSNKSILKQNDDNMALKVEAIKSLNVGAMRAILESNTDKKDNIPYSISITFQLHDNQKVFKSQKELYDFINSIDLSEYLGIYGYVKCILPEHDDHEPSAHIYETDSGTQVYKCFGCNKAYTIIGITEKLAGCKRSEAIEFIKSVYNLQLVQSDWVKQQQQIMIDSANYLDTEEFKTEFPVLSTLIRTRKLHIQKMLMHFTQYVSDDLRVDNKPLFYSNYQTLMEICEIKDKTRMAQSLTLFALLNMIEKLPVESIPEKELTKAKHIAAKYGHKKLTNFYSFEEYGVNSLANSEEIAKTLKANNYSLKGLSREYILRTFGVDLANKCFPQYKYENAKGTTKESDKRTSQIVECLFYCIEQKGYATEKDVVYLLGDKYKYQTTEIQIKKSLQEILVSYGLVRVKASKDNKLKYSISDDVSYQTYVICKNCVDE
ncbi:hypothetical protein [Caproiciproducens sp. LBM24188]